MITILREYLRVIFVMFSPDIAQPNYNKDLAIVFHYTFLVTMSLMVGLSSPQSPLLVIRQLSHGMLDFRRVVGQITNKPGIGLMNWTAAGKSAIVTTGDIVDVTVDLFPRHSPQAIFSIRNRPTECCCCPLSSDGDLTIGVSLWSQGCLEFTDPVPL